jgi:hypothetical protein
LIGEKKVCLFTHSFSLHPDPNPSTEKVNMMFKSFNGVHDEYHLPKSLYEEETYVKPFAKGEDPEIGSLEKKPTDGEPEMDEKLGMNTKETEGTGEKELVSPPPATPARGWLSRIGSTLVWAFSPTPDPFDGAYAYPAPGTAFPSYPYYGGDPELAMAIWGLNYRDPEQEMTRDGEEVEEMIRRVSNSPIDLGGASSGMSRGMGIRWGGARRGP